MISFTFFGVDFNFAEGKVEILNFPLVSNVDEATSDTDISLFCFTFNVHFGRLYAA